MATLKLTTIGTSTGVIIPKDILGRMNVGKGDVLHAIEMSDGSLRLTPFDPAFSEKIDTAEDIMRRYRNTLRALSK